MSAERDPLAGLRSRGRDARRALTDSERATASRRIAATVIRTHEFNAARFIACYLPMREEVDPAGVIARAWDAGRRVYVPVLGAHGSMFFGRLAADTRLAKTPFGLYEPIDTEVIAPRKLDLVITPVVAFDDRGHRIGMGGGYFDRAFAFLKRRRHWLQPKLLGLAFDCQQVDGFEPNPWDVSLYSVVTESGRKTFGGS
ncbi:MAG: 5-formyltetrahydrofolate cyclo-ligase [Woeseiaceae bacterium]|nr:5-formyltetrahydrofolate cyclo-ligase [Woeseiaceae bacterium]